MAATTNPTGLTIERDNLKFIFSWKVAASNHDGGQQLQWKSSANSSWTTVEIGTDITSKKD